MGYLIESEKEMKDILSHYDPQIDDRLILVFPNRIGGYILDPDDIMLFDNRYVRYLGFVNDVESEVMGENYCLYRIKGKLYYHKPATRIEKIEPLIKRKKEIDDSRLLNVDIRPEDNELMVIVKELLRGMTLNTFKSLFLDVSTMSNVRREVEYKVSDNKENSSYKGDLTWNRFKLLLGLLGFDYTLEVKQLDKKT